jgi:hypothetical protein
MKAIKEIAVVVMSTGIVASVLAVYFEWRGRLLRQFRGESRA